MPEQVMPEIDPLEFRNALGQFATGVTIITSLDSDDQPVGVTASSFNSVSLEPPLVLWSLAKNSGSLKAFQEHGHFCVHVLASSHESLSQRFASRGTDKFDGIDWQAGASGLPLLSEFAARFQCKTCYQYEGGDHVIFVGEVIEFVTREETPLVFHKGRYATARTKQTPISTDDAVNVAQGSFSENFFLYLLSRAHFQASYELQRVLEHEGVSQNAYLALTLLGMSGALSYQQLGERLHHTGHVPDQQTLQNMLSQGWVTESPDASQYVLTVKGRNLYIRFLAVSKAAEKNLLEQFDDDEVADARRFLQKFIELSNPGIPDLWSK